MLVISLKNLRRFIERQTGKKITIGDMSETTGIHRNLLSRLNNYQTTEAEERLLKLIVFAASQLDTKDITQICNHLFIDVDANLIGAL